MIAIRADVLREAREARHLSQAALASASNVSERQIRRIEGGQIGHPRIATANRLAAALGLSLDALTDASLLPHLGSTATAQKAVGGSAAMFLDAQASFDLIRRKYGWTRERVVASAPALFLLLAELSVRWHREQAQQLRKLERSLREAGGDQDVVEQVMQLVRQDRILDELKDSSCGQLFHKHFETVFAEYLGTLASND